MCQELLQQGTSVVMSLVHQLKDQSSKVVIIYKGICKGFHNGMYKAHIKMLRTAREGVIETVLVLLAHYAVSLNKAAMPVLQYKSYYTTFQSYYY